MTTINIRIEEKVKVRAARTLSRLGLDMSSAVKLFLNQVVAEDGLPFKPTRSAKEIRARWDAGVAEALTRPGYRTAKELLRDL